MGRAVGWTLLVLLIVLIGTHPGIAVNLTQNFLGVLHRAGDELSTFVSDL